MECFAMLLNRRQFAAAGLASAAFTGLARAALTTQQDAGYRNEVPGFGPLRNDPAGLLDLPEAFSYGVISRCGEAMDDGFIAPDKFDGMAAIALTGSRVALVRNHELKPEDRGKGPAGGLARLEERLKDLSHYGKDSSGRVLPGGTTTLIVDARTGRRQAQYLSLTGTAVNCAGGPTPWGSWLSCEETNLSAPDVERSHGWVFEVPAGQRGTAPGKPLEGLGRFRHEAASVDPVTGIVYLTEDHANGLFYRFVPKVPGKLDQGGRLQALAIDGLGDTRNWTSAEFAPGTSRAVRWIDLEETHSPKDDLRSRGAAAGAAVFARGEGLEVGQGEFYFTCTSGGAAKLGQIFRLRPARDGRPETIDLFFESGDRQLFEYGDNLTIAPNGDLVVCEDRSGDAVNYLRGVTPAGKVYTIARLRMETELAGATFSPSGEILFLNAYSPGRTLAIRGPWKRAALTA
jgi:secreted PhoX family phosphatase